MMGGGNVPRGTFFLGPTGARLGARPNAVFQEIVPRGTICKFPGKRLIRQGFGDILNEFKSALANFADFIFEGFPFWE